jgi:putative pyruvate formate lyase activating enzyme
MSLEEVMEQIERIIHEDEVHNINFVTPDHFFPYTFSLCRMIRERGHSIPMLYNLSGYQSVKWLRVAESYADIYLPDFKYSDRKLASALSRCGDYPDVAVAALSEMVRQKGFLDSFLTGSPTASKGVLVRHLILPGHVGNSKDVLTTLFIEFGPHLPISLMSQYSPMTPEKDPCLRRKVLKDEFDEVFEHAMDLGFEYLFAQFPLTEELIEGETAPFLPDFNLVNPFSKR